MPAPPINDDEFESDEQDFDGDKTPAEPELGTDEETAEAFHGPPFGKPQVNRTENYARVAIAMLLLAGVVALGTGIWRHWTTFEANKKAADELTKAVKENSDATKLKADAKKELADAQQLKDEAENARAAAERMKDEALVIQKDNQRKSEELTKREKNVKLMEKSIEEVFVALGRGRDSVVRHGNAIKGLRALLASDHLSEEKRMALRDVLYDLLIRSGQYDPLIKGAADWTNPSPFMRLSLAEAQFRTKHLSEAKDAIDAMAKDAGPTTLEALSAADLELRIRSAERKQTTDLASADQKIAQIESDLARISKLLETHSDRAAWHARRGDCYLEWAHMLRDRKPTEKPEGPEGQEGEAEAIEKMNLAAGSLEAAARLLMEHPEQREDSLGDVSDDVVVSWADVRRLAQEFGEEARIAAVVRDSDSLIRTLVNEMAKPVASVPEMAKVKAIDPTILKVGRSTDDRMSDVRRWSNEATKAVTMANKRVEDEIRASAQGVVNKTVAILTCPLMNSSLLDQHAHLKSSPSSPDMVKGSEINWTSVEAWAAETKVALHEIEETISRLNVIADSVKTARSDAQSLADVFECARVRNGRIIVSVDHQAFQKLATAWRARGESADVWYQPIIHRSEQIQADMSSAKCAVDPNSAARAISAFDRALSAYLTHDHDEAYRLLTRSIELNPADPRPYYLRALIASVCSVCSGSFDNCDSNSDIARAVDLERRGFGKSIDMNASFERLQGFPRMFLQKARQEVLDNEW